MGHPSEPDVPPGWPAVRAGLAAGWMLGLAGFALAVGLLWGYLEREHRRLEPWQLLLIWTNEAVAGFWFVRFGVRHAVLGDPLPADDPAAVKYSRGFWAVVGTLALGWAVDLGVTLHNWRVEAAAFARSVPADGRVVTAAHRPTQLRGGTTLFELDCEFADAAGDVYETTFLVLELEVPPATAAAVRKGQLPAPVPLRYDPDWPPRTWLPAQDADWGNRLHWVSFFPLMLQAVLTAWIVFGGGVVRTRAGLLPVYRVGPFVVSSAGLLFVGMLRWLEGFPTI